MTYRSSALPEPSARQHRHEISLRIVVADDNVDSATSLEKLLQLAGYDVVAVAYDGPSALEAILRRRATVALLDIALPGIDGYHIARLVRERLGASLRLVAVTGLSHASDRADAMAAGFNAHLPKPVDWQSLDAQLRSYEAELCRQQHSPQPGEPLPARPR